MFSANSRDLHNLHFFHHALGFSDFHVIHIWAVERNQEISWHATDSNEQSENIPQTLLRHSSQKYQLSVLPLQICITHRVDWLNIITISPRNNETIAQKQRDHYLAFDGDIMLFVIWLNIVRDTDLQNNIMLTWMQWCSHDNRNTSLKLVLSIEA